MKSIRHSIEIKGSVSDVFEAVADPVIQMKYDGEMMRGSEKLTEGPIAQGTRFRGDFKGMGKMEYVYSTFKQDHLIEHEVKMPFGFLHHCFMFEAMDNGTRLTQSMDLAPNILGNILWPVLMKKMLNKRMLTFNALLKQYIEGQDIPKGYLT